MGPGLWDASQAHVVNLLLPSARTRLVSKPQVESRARVEQVCDLSCVKQHAKKGKLTRWSLKHQLAITQKECFACGAQCVTSKRKTRRLLVHTGALDGFWKHMKDHVPHSVRPRSVKLLTYARAFQCPRLAGNHGQ